jgi:hypothetical protein
VRIPDEVPDTSTDAFFIKVVELASTNRYTVELALLKLPVIEIGLGWLPPSSPVKLTVVCAREKSPTLLFPPPLPPPPPPQAVTTKAVTDSINTLIVVITST